MEGGHDGKSLNRYWQTVPCPSSRWHQKAFSQNC